MDTDISSSKNTRISELENTALHVRFSRRKIQRIIFSIEVHSQSELLEYQKLLFDNGNIPIDTARIDIQSMITGMGKSDRAFSKYVCENASYFRRLESIYEEIMLSEIAYPEPELLKNVRSCIYTDNLIHIGESVKKFSTHLSHPGVHGNFRIGIGFSKLPQKRRIHNTVAESKISKYADIMVHYFFVITDTRAVVHTSK